VPRFPPAITGVTSTAPCPADAIKSLYFAGISKLHEIYGSTESGAMGHRDHPDDPLTLVPFWKRTGPSSFVRSLPDGRDSQEFLFQDDLDWVDERRFRILKRIDHAVKVGGVNVFPSRVEEVLRRHESVEECAVRLMRPDEGDRLKAFIVLTAATPPGDQVERSIREFIARELGHLEQPRSLTFGETVPRNETGKLADWPTRPQAAAPGSKPMDRAEAVEKLRSESHRTEPGQAFELARFAPRDAWAVTSSRAWPRCSSTSPRSPGAMS